jgi:hypothetical protein
VVWSSQLQLSRFYSGVATSFAASRFAIDKAALKESSTAIRALPRIVGVEPIDDAKHRLHGGYVGFAFLDWVEACQVRKRVEVDRTCEAVDFDLPKQLDRLEGMDGANHQAVVPLRISFVQMHAEKAAVSINQRGCEGGLLVRIEHMREIEGDADIREADFLKGKERRRAIRN